MKAPLCLSLLMLLVLLVNTSIICAQYTVSTVYEDTSCNKVQVEIFSSSSPGYCKPTGCTCDLQGTCVSVSCPTILPKPSNGQMGYYYYSDTSCGSFSNGTIMATGVCINSGSGSFFATCTSLQIYSANNCAPNSLLNNKTPPTSGACTNSNTTSISEIAICGGANSVTFAWVPLVFVMLVFVLAQFY